MIISNIIHRVFHIRYGSQSATAFTIDVDGKQYLVTARHVFGVPQSKPEAYSTPSFLEVHSNGSWVPLSVTLVGHGPGQVDVTVLSPAEQITPSGLPISISNEGIVYGQDVYFLGYPFGVMGSLVFGPSGYPLPFVKKAILSLLNAPNGMFYLDGHNNLGFSGGPVVFNSGGSGPPNAIAAVISGYLGKNMPVLAGDVPLSVGSPAAPVQSHYNTGIIYCHPIQRALELIRANPIGIDVK